MIARFWLFACLLAPSLAQSANVLFNDWQDSPLAFSLSFHNHYLPLTARSGQQYDGYLVGARAEITEMFSPHLYAAMAMERQLSEGVGSGKGDGHYYELSLVGILRPFPALQLATRASFFYQALEGEDQQFLLRSRGLAGELLAKLYLVDYIAFCAGFGGHVSDGQLRLNETLDIDFHDNINLVYKAGIDILVDQGGHVGIESRVMEKPSIEVYFQRRY